MCGNESELETVRRFNELRHFANFRPSVLSVGAAEVVGESGGNRSELRELHLLSMMWGSRQSCSRMEGEGSEVGASVSMGVPSVRSSVEERRQAGDMICRLSGRCARGQS